MNLNKVYGCFGENVPILLSNGLIKKSQDIKIGDILMGDDYTERIVEEVITGEDDLFEVRQMNGINYVVNTKHILLLKNVIDSTTELAFDISTEQYMSLNDLYKSMLCGYKCKKSNTSNIESLIYENSPITIIHIGKGTYYGWAINQNKKFLLSDFTVVHNCDKNKSSGYELK
jgi:hypothetical protein